MRNQLLLIVLFVFIGFGAKSQAIETRLEYQKTLQPAATVSVACDQEKAEDGLKEFMSRKAAKGSGFKDFILFKSYRLDNDKELTDLYFKIERKSRKEKDLSLITLVTARKGEELQAHAMPDQALIKEALSLLNQLASYIESHQINMQVSVQEQVLTKAQKKLADLMDEEADLEKKVRKIQAESDENKNDLFKQTREVESKINSDFETHQKAEKKLNHLIDDKGDYEKKLRKAQADLEQNRKEQQAQNEIIIKEQQVLSAIKAKQKPA